MIPFNLDQPLFHLASDEAMRVGNHPKGQARGRTNSLIHFLRSHNALRWILLRAKKGWPDVTNDDQAQDEAESPHSLTPPRIDVNVLSRDSWGTDSTNLLINHPSPNGIERLRLMDSHSTTTPPFCSL